MTSQEAAIRVENLGKRYQIYASPRDRLKQFIVPGINQLLGRPPQEYFREFWALRDVSFEVKAGETVGIIGKNGAGKSTLLQLICGTATPTQGVVATRGRLTALLELGAGFNPDFTGTENVFASGAIHGLSKAEMERKFDAVASFAEIGDFIEQPVRTYSSGMYVRLAFAVQVCLDPDILVVDEALAVGDAYFVHRCFDRIREMQSNNKTILFVSHDTGSVRSLCHRAIWIDEGRVQAIGDPDEVSTLYRANLFNIPVCPKQGEPVPPPSTGQTNPTSISTALERHEQHIPNVDRRIGVGCARIVGVGVYDSTREFKVTQCKNGSDVVLRISVCNERLAPGSELIVGFAIRTPRGDEVAALNSQMLGNDVPCPPLGGVVTVSIRITLPLLHPSDYSFTVAVATQEGAEKIIQDRIDNSIIIRVFSDIEIIGLTRIPAEFIVEPTIR